MENYEQKIENDPIRDDQTFQAVDPAVAQQPAQVSPPAPMAAQPAHATNAGLIVLQWLTYAFWGWTVLAMSFLTAIVIANFIAGADDGSFTPYAIAAVLVLLPISVACDVFYSKQEPEKKTGAASIVMVIHAVLFALFGIGALIAIVFSLVQLFTSSSDSTNTHAALYSEIIIAFLYAIVFLRTLNPLRLAKFRRFFPILMVVVVGIISVLGFIGPVAHAHATRNDRLIDDNLYNVQTSVDDYVNSHKQLPDNLGNLGLNGDAKKLIDDNLVQYIPNSMPAAVSSDTYSSNSYDSSSTGTGVTIKQAALPKTYYYELCVNYKKSSGNDSGSSDNSNLADANGYSTYISTTDHPAGKFCYKASTTPMQY